jgi:pyridoxamine 5'-phosphate oxidase
VTGPLERVQAWFDEAVAAGVVEPDAMALATADPGGRPSVRMVLLKGIDERGIRFFTNYESRKGRELAANPRAAVAIHWMPLGRQIRMEGPVERLPPEESDAYFASRPPGSRISAAASRQGSVLSSRADLEERAARLADVYGDGPIPRPEYWGGYLLRPDAVEFWEHRPDRLHDREHFVLQADGSWRAERLEP